MLLIAGYAWFEWNAFSSTPDKAAQQELAEQAVESANDRFRQYLFDFSNESALFSEFVQTEIAGNRNLLNTFQRIEADFNFWGSIVYREGERLIWNGFVPDEYPGSLLGQNQSSYTSIGTDNNVTYLFSINPFFVEGDSSVIRYDVYTRTKLSQENILALGRELEQYPSQLFGDELQYPVHFGFNEISGEDVIASAYVSTANTDSVAAIYTLDSDFDRFRFTLQEGVNVWRAFFLVMFLVVGGLLVLSLSRNIGGSLGLLIQLGAFTTVWLLVKSIYPLIDTQNYSSVLLNNLFLVEYIVNSVFALLVCFSLVPFLIETKKITFITQPARLIFISLIIGSGSGIIFYRFLLDTSVVVINSSIRVMDLELLPDVETLIFYLSSSILFSSIIITSVTFFRVLLNTEKQQFWMNLAGLLIGFITFYLIGRYSFAGNFQLHWAINITALFFGIALLFAFILRQRSPSFLYASKLRLLMFFSYLSVCFIYICYSNGNMIRQDARMLEVAESFAVDEETEIEEITIRLLRSLSNELQSVPENLFQDSFFDQLVQNYIQPDWLKYTISVQLINPEGDRFVDYTTSLSPPQWSTAFRISDLEIPFEGEQIRRRNLRPVIRTQPQSPQTLSSSYSSFRRGWIPLFASPDSDERVGWILCSVYKELPQLDRPLRTVISSNENTNWEQTLSATEYQNGVPIRSSITGVPLEIPGPAILSQGIIEEVQRDSIVQAETTYGSSTIKELFVKEANGDIIRVASKKITPTQHFFSFLRLFFVLVMSGVALMILFSWKKEWHIFGHTRRFRDRLVDRFILASLFCLIALVGASYYVLNSQNQEDVQERLYDRLGNLVPNIESEFTGNYADAASLQRVTSILDVDAALYKDGVLVNSTTSQIFAQHLLPTTVPWDIYQIITQNESSQELQIIELDGQEMMIGYEPWLDADNNIAGIAAIPTFLKAPKFYERLLSTTSYLLGFYTLIFGLLMLAVGFISSQLTSPLEALQEGLRNISAGDLETTLPVKSEDEIGTLTRAYNEMGTRLKKLQIELAKTEREEAWKEMAQQVAHEIKNPLTPMKLNLQHLERQLESVGDDLEKVKPKISKIAANMIEQIDSLNKIASDFSKFAKPLEQEFYPFDANDVARSVADLYLQDTSFKLTTDIKDEKMVVSGVKEELRRVLVNLIKNAKEALGESGKITLTTFTDPAKDNLFIEVTDNGEGIPAEDQDRIFVPNFSTKSSGTGLGLAISKKIIEEHNGEITFISTKGQGTSFTIRLPLLEK